jgi:hypothetical protein
VSAADGRLTRAPSVVNLGLEIFADELKAAGIAVVHVDWRPPVGGSAVAALLARLDD